MADQPATAPADARVLLRGHLEDVERAFEHVAYLLARTRDNPLLSADIILLLWRSKAAASVALASLPIAQPPYNPAPLTFLNHQPVPDDHIDENFPG